MRLDEAFKRLRQANEEVPLPLMRPSLEAVEAVEHELGFAFPADYRRFLLEASDVVAGVLEPGLIHSRSGYRDLRNVARQGWKFGIPRSQLPFCEHNGDYFTVDSAGTVRDWHHDDESSRQVGGITAWIEEWLEDLDLE